MNRQDLAKAIAIKLDIAQTDAMKFIESFEQIVHTALSEDGDVALMGFGRFYRKKYRARLKRNPHTGETITLPARYVPVFTPGKMLREKLNQIS